MNTCKACGKTEAELQCGLCKASYHRACTATRILRGGESSFVCEDCGLEVADERSEAGRPLSSTVLPGHKAACSNVGTGDDNEDNARKIWKLEATIEALQRSMREMQASLGSDVSATATDAPRRARVSATPTQIGQVTVPVSEQVVLHEEPEMATPFARRSSESDDEGSTVEKCNRSTLNKSQAAIWDSIRRRPLTRNELDHRKGAHPLPIFDGHPSRWYNFYAVYTESTKLCGYSKVENLVRLDQALKGDARRVVTHLLTNHLHVDSIMESLERNFGRPEIQLANITTKVNLAPSLNENMDNIQEFYAVVDEACRVVQLMDGPVPEFVLVKSLVTKLPDAIWREWNRFHRGRVGGLTLFCAFIVDLCNEAMTMSLQKAEMKSTAPSKSRKLPKERVFLADQEQPGETEPTPCSFGCESDHGWDKCPAFKRKSPSERQADARNGRRCYSCLGVKHIQADCPNLRTCTVEGCERKHHPLLHSVQKKPRPAVMTAVCDTNDQLEPEPSPAVERQSGLVAMSSVKQPTTFFRTVAVIVSANGTAIRTRALLDTGSSVTLLRTELASRLKLEGKSADMPLSWADGKTKVVKSRRVELSIRGRGTQAFPLYAQTMDELRLPESTVDESLLAAEFDDSVQVDIDPRKPEILIGQDNARLMMTCESQIGSSGTLVASRTPLGWLVEGERPGAHERRCLFMGPTTEDDSLEQIVREYIDADHFGLLPDDQIRCESDQNLRALAIMDRTTVYRDGRYETGLLWRTDDIALPKNFQMAAKRQRNFERKLKHDRGLWTNVDSIMKTYLGKGYIKPVATNRVTARDWYLPIFTVQNPNKPNKIRVVFDAAAGVGDRSLNSALITGPDLTAPLIHILQRFRYGRFALSADIEEMFLRIAIRAEDHCAQRFLWRGPDDTEVVTYQMERMTFGATCSPSLAQYVKNKNAERFRRTHPEAVNAIVRNHYVDDWLESCETEEQAVALATNVSAIHARGGFRLNKWLSNSATVLDCLGHPQAAVDREVSGGRLSLVLGLQWSTTDDSLSFRYRGERIARMVSEVGTTTKRELLRIVMSLYDPLGLISFLTVLPKLLLRELWRAECGWDEPIHSGACARLRGWMRCLANIGNVHIPRWHGTSGRQVTLHIFVDASDSALAAVAYVVQRHEDLPTARSLCLSKCKVAPLRSKSIPRLELDAAVLGVRVLGLVLAAECWRVDRVVMWSDAQDVLYWIRSTDRRYGQYVANRVAAILEKTDVSDWRYVPSAENPADWGTKWNINRKDESLWWRGPAFLDEEEERWPNSFATPSVVLEERRVMMTKHDLTHPLVPPVERFSSWVALVRNVATAMQFVNVIRGRRDRGPATRDELLEAEALVCREAQRSMTKQELQRFSPFVDQYGVQRMRGRTAHATHLTFNARYPVILPGGHPVTWLIVKQFHSSGNHQNHQRTLNELRQQYVLVRPRSTLNRIIRACQACIVEKARPSYPEMGALPACRLGVGCRPFSYTGVDLFGPFNVAIGRRREKRWGALFTCLTTRAVYLELVPSLSARSCVMAIDSLAARRGVPVEIRSDNGTNFVAAAKTYRGPNGSRPIWRFNPPSSPHMGGSWERLVGIVKRALTRMDLDKTPTEERLRHLLVKAEAIVNSRPLTEIPSEDHEEEALTPNHFLLGNSTGTRTEADVSPSEDVNLAALKCEMDRALQSFWLRWSSEYLPLISGRSKWTKKTTNLAVGDVVFICDGDYRLGWRRGRIAEVYVDDESGQVRQVVVVAAGGARYRRAAHRIAPIVKAAS